MNRFKILLSFILFSLFAQAHAQNIKKEIISLENSFKAFEYEKVIRKGKFLLADPYTTTEDSMLIYQYMLSSAYTLNDTTQAREFIHDLLNNRPDFALNPVDTSPKIVEFFNLIKKDFKAEPVIQASDSKIIQFPEKFEMPKSSTIMLGILVPGTAHLIQSNRKNGAYFTTISGLLLGSSVYFVYKTSSDRKAYMKARDGSNFNSLYSTYNSSFKTRNTLAIAYGIWSLYCLFDFHKSFMLQPKYESEKQSLSLAWQYRW